MNDPCDHDWHEIQVGCEDCGEHPGLVCPECLDVVDLIYQDDPRDNERG